MLGWPRLRPSRLANSELQHLVRVHGRQAAGAFARTALVAGHRRHVERQIRRGRLIWIPGDVFTGFGQAGGHLEDPFVSRRLRVTLHLPHEPSSNFESVARGMLCDIAGHPAIDVRAGAAGRRQLPAWATEVAALAVSPDPDRWPLWCTIQEGRWVAGSFPYWHGASERISLRGLGERSAAFLHAAYREAFAHSAAGGHLFVTNSRQLLQERDDGYWTGVEIVTPREALGIVGAYLRLVDYDADGDRRNGVDTALHALSEVSWTASPLPSSAESAVTGKLLDIYCARDTLVPLLWEPRALSSLLPRLHALTGLFVTGHGLFEAWALGAARRLGVEIHSKPIDGLQRRLRADVELAPATQQAFRASPTKELLGMLRAFRHSVAHAGVLGGGASWVRGVSLRPTVGLTRHQCHAVRELARVTKQKPRALGLVDHNRELGQLQPLEGTGSCDAWRLADETVRQVCEAFVRLSAALAEDLGDPLPVTHRPPDTLNWMDVARRAAFGGLAGAPLLMDLQGLREDLA